MVIRAYPRVGDYKEPFIKLIVAFLEQVLHIEKSAILDISFETTCASGFLSPCFPSLPGSQEYAVTVRLQQTDLLGDKIYLVMEYRGGEYSISQLAFQPGWKPVAKEQKA